MVFEEALKQAGVTILCGKGVSQINLNESGRCCGVTLDNGIALQAARCICTVHPKTLLTLLPESVFRPAYRRRIDDMRETASAVVLFGRGAKPLISGNLILIDDPESVWNWQERPMEERPLFISAPDGCDAGGISIICPATMADVPNGDGHERFRRSEAYKGWKQAVTDRLLERVARHAGDAIRDFELLESASPLTFRDWVGSPAGGIYGVQHRQDEMPLLPQTRVPGLYLSGQAVVAPGVLGAMCAGFLTESCVA
jgi:all-trans-retinol 13,14-reductase